MEQTRSRLPAFFHRAGWRERRKFRELEGKLRRLGEWPGSIPLDEISLVREIAVAGRHVFRATRALVMWESPDEPYRNLAFAAEDRFEVQQEAPDAWEPFMSAELADEDAFYLDLSDGTARVLKGGVRRVKVEGALLHPELVRRFSIQSALVVRIRAEGLEGWAIYPGIARPARWDLLIARLVGALASRRADHVAQVAASRLDAVNDERERVARDLHDGLLQSFTGIVLQLETVHAVMDEDSVQARKLLTEAEASIMNDQRELRAYVDELRPRARRKSTEYDLSARLAELQKRFSTEWKIDLSVKIGVMHPLVTQALGQETYRMISEAVMNSAKHGQASRIDVALGTREDQLWIRVSDDGIGFPFRGRYNLETLIDRQIGPAVLAERVAALNGEMTIFSTEEGASVEIFLPLGWRAE
ncbi:MAG: sensor histidine kinase [Thermoanaerobaculia bacterium]